MGINYKGSLRVFGSILLILSLTMLLPVVTAIYYSEKNCIMSFMVVLVPVAVCGGLLVMMSKGSKSKLHIRDGAFIVAITWFMCSFFGALPFVISGSIPGMADAFFETASGFTTTGATILTDIEALPKSMLFWRSFTHWLGGMGILQITLALLPALGMEGQQLAVAEVPGPTLSKVTPKLSTTARYLYTLYLVFTLAETLLLMAGGLSFFDAICHAFASLGTGGFSTYNSSIAHFDSLYVEIVIIIFMYLAGINFNLFFFFYRNGIKAFYRDSEWVLYTVIIVITTLIITLSLYFSGTFSLGESLRQAAFQDVSLITTTGFGTSDYVLWPSLAQMMLFLLLFVGGCTSSTGGGIKVMRVLVLLKLIKRTISLRLHPNAVVNIRINRQLVPKETVSGITNFVFAYIGLGTLFAFIISFDGYDLITNISAAFTCLGNVGPGFNALGPSHNFSIFSDFTKTVCSFAMIAGRLEIYTVLMLFSRRFWNPYH